MHAAARAHALGPSWPRWIATLVAALVLLVAGLAHAREVPALAGRVTDEAEVLGPAQRQHLEQLLGTHEQATGRQFAVLIVSTLEGDPIEDFGIRVVESWELGQEGKDDGLLMLVAMQERKIRIEVGYGLEGDIPDAIAGRVIRDVMRPRFRSGDVAGGIEAGLVKLMEASGWTVPTELSRGRPRGGVWAGTDEQRHAPIGALIVVFVLAAILTFAAPVLAFILWFAGFGGLSSALGGIVILPLILGMILGGIGRRFTSRGGDSWWSGAGPWFIAGTGFGGGFGGGGGGGIGGGGFGGFSGGGGGFGGGGASGGW